MAIYQSDPLRKSLPELVNTRTPARWRHSLKTGIAAADISRIRNADLNRFTVDRLMAVINLLDARVGVAVKVRIPRAA